MDEETETAIIDYINSIKPRTLDITWYGGEPLMNFKTIERLTDKINELSYIENLKYDIILLIPLVDPQPAFTKTKGILS